VDLNTVIEVLRPPTREALPCWTEGDAFLAGGTWIFSEPQAGLRRLVDLTELGWTPLTLRQTGLEVAATCSLAALEAFEPPGDWRAAPLIGQCCRALLGSFKIRRVATVGGNLCLALPAAPMAALAVALHGVCSIWDAAGGERELPTQDLITGASKTSMAQGDILRSVLLSADVLRRRAAFRQMSLTTLGRSAALLIGTRAEGAIEFTLTAAVARPVRLLVPEAAGTAELRDAIDGSVPNWYDDLHGRPAWRRRIVHLMAIEIFRELQA
jgi:CO/xanthine dehydrogenase FAD-binding subunit